MSKVTAKKTPEDIKSLREISARLKELGCPTKNLDRWIDNEEAKPEPQVVQDIGDGSIKHFQGGPCLSHDKPMVGHFES